jgi:hypothetical protein
VQSYGSKDDIVEYLDVLIKYCNENNKPFNLLVLHLAHGKGFNHETRPIYQQQKRLETSEDTKVKVFSRIAPSCSNLSEWLEWFDELIVAYIALFGTPPVKDIEEKLKNWPWKVDSFMHINQIFQEMRDFIGKHGIPHRELHNRQHQDNRTKSKEELQLNISEYIFKVL